MAPRTAASPARSPRTSRTGATRARAAARRSAPPADLREACVQAAHAVIAESGIEKLSLRDVARRLNVSHQAPYKHYPSRDHLLAEVIRRCFQRFTAALNARAVGRDPRDPMSAMHGLGEAYLRFALEHPLEYRLMFGTPWPGAADHPDLLRDARHAFDVLRDALAQLHGSGPGARERIEQDAMFVWSTMHGLATILQCNAVEHLDLHVRVLDHLAEHVMQRIDAALKAPPAR